MSIVKLHIYTYLNLELGKAHTILLGLWSSHSLENVDKSKGGWLVEFSSATVTKFFMKAVSYMATTSGVC